MKNYLLLVMLITSTPSWCADGDVFTAKSIEGVDVTYKVINEQQKICQVGKGFDGSNYTDVSAVNRQTSGSLTIQDRVNGYQVKAIGEYALMSCQQLTSVSLPEGLERIDDFAFSSSGILTMTIPESVVKLGNGVFIDCLKLENIQLPSGLEEIPDQLLRGCTALTSLQLPVGVKRIGQAALNCFALQELRVAEGNTVYDSRQDCNAIILTAENKLLYGCNTTVVPEGITSIARDACQGFASLMHVVIPSSVVSVGANAFSYCNGLTTVDFQPSSGTVEIGDSAFFKCNNLQRIALPEHLKVVPRALCSSCTSLSEVVFPLSAESIEPYAFYNCTSLTDLTIGDGIKLIGDCAFQYCSHLQHVVLPEGIHTLETQAFAGCNDLQSINLPQSLRIIGRATFYSDRSLTDVTLPEQLELIDDNAFEYCMNQKALSLPQGLKYIGYRALPPMTSLHIPASVCYIGGAPCSYSYAPGDNVATLTSITVDAGNRRYDSRGGCNAVIETATGRLLQGCSSTTIPAGVTAIGDYAFYAMLTLTSIHLPEGITEIGEGAFRSTSLTKVHLPSSLKRLGGSAFDYCRSLEQVTGGENVEETTGLDIERPFDRTPWDEALPDGINYIGKLAYVCKGDISGTLTFRDGTRGIGNGFNLSKGSSVDTIELPEGLTTIGAGAFNGLNGLQNLTNVTFPTSLRSISGLAFEYCRGLTTLDLPEGLTSIGNYAFNEATGLNTLSVPGTVTSIGSQVFKSQTFAAIPWYDAQPDGPVYAGQVFLGYKGEIPEYTHLTIDDGTLGIAGDALQYHMSSANLTSIELPASITSIGDEAFGHCTGLKSISIPAAVKSIGEQIISDCEHIQTICSYMDEPFETHSNIFKWIDMYRLYRECKLMVPMGARERYEQTFPWCLFQHIEEFEMTDIKQPTVAGSMHPKGTAACYSISGIRLPAPQRGLNIVRGKDGTLRKVIIR